MARCPSAVSHAADAFQPGGRTVPLPGREDPQPWPRKRPRRALLDRRLRDVADPTHPFLLGPPLSAGTHSVDSVAFSPYGHTLASGDDDGTSPTRHIPCRWPVSRPASPPSPWRSALSAARWPAPASSSTCSISLPTPFTPAARQVPEPRHQGGVLGGVQPHGRVLASGDDATIRLWDIADAAHPVLLGQPLTRRHRDGLLGRV
jgi:WD domain, G-beta repeat